MAFFEAGIDKYLVRAILQRHHLVVAHAETPALVEERRPVRNPIGLVRQCKEMALQSGQVHRLPDRRAVVDDVQVGSLEIDYLFSFGTRYISDPTCTSS